jgi:hypothetical protein
MALVQKTHLVRLRFRDNDGAESTCDINIAQSIAPATALSYAAAIRPLAAALSSAICIEYSVIVRWTETSKPAPAATSDTQRVGAFIFETSTAGNRAIVLLPSLDETYLVTPPDPFAGIKIDQADTDIAAFITAMESGLAGVEPVSPFALDLVTCTEAYRQERP